MRNNFLILCVVLLMEGVSGDVAVQVLTGDSVTLKPVNVTLKKNDLILWKRNGTLISTMKKAEDSISITFPDKKFSGRLKPDNKTGSLIITNITTDLAGLYQVVMKTTTETSESYSVTVNGNVESVSMLEGDSVTLHTGVTKKQGDQILWKFGDKNLNGDVDYTITNICQTGHYEVEIHTSSIILHRKFSITCSGGERTMSVMEEKPITLDTSHIKIQGYDQILWEFEGQIIAEIDQRKNLFLHHDSRVERLKGRLQLDKNSGSLTISFSRKTDSGVYHLQMNSRSHTLQRNISVTVSDYSPPSTPPPGAAVDVSVLEGDSVTLEADNITLKTDDWIRWKFNGIFICKMKKTGEDFIIKNDFDLDKKFIGRLEPNIKTGSLKITDITADHAGLYKVEMKSTTDTSKNYIVTVNGVESVSMLEGDSVTLHTGVTKIQRDQIHWKFEEENLTGDVDYTITNICKTGHYEVEIQTSSIILHRKFSITCSDGERTLLENEEQRIILDTGFLNIQGYDQIWWEFEGQIIAKINQTANQLSHLDNKVKRFKGRLQLNENSGSLTISKTKSTDSGVYHLQMKSRSHTLQRNITVTVSDSSRIYASFGLVVWAVTLSLLQV